ncbi:MAG TPA: bifunctional hydroxymethylpyrimidine kinase/phosphomethylpyrimidine kinase [Vicinamibacterales bacterium]|nr:bifunctional hydroxymethylpyrimidine kinase/phosphomethylpyrimidine kinase [Vicinamibacterales bacterium]
MKRALTIAGSDSGGGAGIQADLKTFAAHGVYGTSAITAITAQNTLGVTAVHTVPADIVVAQIEAVASDIGADAVKTGMLATAAIVEAVAAALVDLDLPCVVVDPVMVAKGGARLLDAEAIDAMKAELIPRAMVITPNAAEAAALVGDEVRTLEQARRAARHLKALGPGAVIVKGGHLEGPHAVDVLFDGIEVVEFRSERIATTSTHGTGCTFASAIAANLALGHGLREAVQRAKDYLVEAIRRAPRIGGGRGPIAHFR